jgi:peptidase E
MIRYYCSGFDINNAFGHGLGDMFKTELKSTKSIVYIPGSVKKIKKAEEIYIPAFTKHFKNEGIVFDEINLLTPKTNPNEAQEKVKNASFIMLMGGNPFEQKDMCEKLGIISSLKNYDGLMLGFSAGAMLMSKYMIVTPCSAEYPNFRIEKGLNLDNISIYPHNNTNSEEYPNELVSGDEIYRKEDLIKVAKKYGEYYLIQDNVTDISLIKSTNGNIEYYTENNGKIWVATPNSINLVNNKVNQKTL